MDKQKMIFTKFKLSIKWIDGTILIINNKEYPVFCYEYRVVNNDLIFMTFWILSKHYHYEFYLRKNRLMMLYCDEDDDNKYVINEELCGGDALALILYLTSNLDLYNTKKFQTKYLTYNFDKLKESLNKKKFMDANFSFM